MPQCPHEESGSDSLFLLEVLIKDVHYSYSNINLNRNLLASLQETCVLVKFLHYPVMEIRQDTGGRMVDFNARDVNLGAGKSCLFSLDKRNLASNQKLDIAFNVLRIGAEGSGCKCVSIGKAVVDLSQNFLQLLKKSCTTTCPAKKCISESYPLINDQCQRVGTLSVFLRLSCFGNQITTQFKMSSSDRESYVFKGEDGKDNLNVPSECFKVDCTECGNKDESSEIRRKSSRFGEVTGNVWEQQPAVPCPAFPGSQLPLTPGPQIPQQVPQQPYLCPEWQAPPPGSTPAGNFPGYPYFGGVQGFAAPPSFYPSEYYPPRNMGGLMPPQFGGMADDIYQYGKPWAERDDSCSGRGRIKTPVSPCASAPPCPPDITTVKAPSPCSQRRQKCELKNGGQNGKDVDIPSFPKDYPFCQRVTIGETESEDTPAPEGHKLNLCDCDYPTPPGLLNPCPPPPKPKKKKPPCPLEMQPGDYCLRSDCPCGLPMVPWLKTPDGDTEVKEKKKAGKFTMAPGSVGVKGKQIIFQMNDKDIPLTEADKKFMASTQYKLGAIGDKAGPKNVIQVMPERIEDPLADKEHDIFILKIGKKNDESKKAKMEIELKSPKYEDKTPKKIDNETQWLDSDLPAEDKAGKAAKGGKGGKGKGGKKGKK